MGSYIDHDKKFGFYLKFTGRLWENNDSQTGQKQIARGRLKLNKEIKFYDVQIGQYF